MKQAITAMLVLSLLLAGCRKEEEEPEKIKVVQVVKKIEVNKKYDPLTFIRDTNGNGYFISVAQDDIINTSLGSYSITFLVETSDRERSEEVTYQIEVVDTTRPQITCSGSISIEKGKEFKTEEYATAIDNYDGDITREIVVEGNLDTNTAGTYPLVLSVSDSSGNEDKKNITIYVEETEEPEEEPVSEGLYGTYIVDYDTNQKFNPTLVLNEDYTFTLTINYCAGMQTFEGTFVTDNSVIILTSSNFDFDEEPGSSTVEIKINGDQTLTYLSTYGACSPLPMDVFKKIK